MTALVWIVRALEAAAALGETIARIRRRRAEGHENEAKAKELLRKAYDARIERDAHAIEVLRIERAQETDSRKLRELALEIEWREQEIERVRQRRASL